VSSSTETPAPLLPVTALRRSFRHARSLSPEAQIQECIDRLTHPERLVAETLDAWEVMQLCCFELDLDRDPDAEKEAQAKAEEGPPGAEADATLVEKFIWKTRELAVQGDHCSFTCLATNVNPMAPKCHASDGLSTGLDYVGLTCDGTSALVLGAVQAPGDSTAYPLLLRLLACLTEIAPPTQLERMNQDRFLGLANASSKFDLNLVLWDRSEQPETDPISQLTRDLAEKVKEALVQSPSFPPMLRDIVCLRMNPDRFTGRMRFDWRV
jgi:hypothetical protein